MGHPRQGDAAAVGTLLGGRDRERVRPYASLLMRQPEPLADHLRAIRAQGFRAFKIGWGPFGRHSHILDEHTEVVTFLVIFLLTDSRL